MPLLCMAMAFCHAKERLASWKVDGSWADKEESHGVEVTPRLAILGFYG